MVAVQHYHWDFIGLSTDNKPTPETSEQVVDGSTYYCSDTSKLYVWYKNQWYEKVSSGGGGGTTYTAGDNITISPENVISATDTTYSDFTGTDGTTAGASGLVPAPATTDAGKFLKSDGTWDEAGGGDSPIKAFVPTATITYAVDIEPGAYVWASGTGNTYYIRCGSQSEVVYDGDIFVVHPAGSIGYADKTISVLRLEDSLFSRFGWATSNGSWNSEYRLQPTDDLTTSSTGKFLDARQGYRVNQKIMGQPINAQGTPLPWTSIGTGSSYTKRALQVTLNISETGLTIPADTWTSLGITMPTNFIPTITMLGSVTASNNGTFEAGLIRVNTDGTVEVHTSNATTDIYGSIVFPVGA